MAIEASSSNGVARRIRLGMVGGGQGAFIGAVHRIAARMDDRYELVAGALSANPERARASAAGLHIAQSLKRSGCRVLVHDYASNTKNSPALLEFEQLADPAKLKNEKRVKAVLICNPWPGYRTVKFPKGAKVFDPWGVLA